MQVEVLEQAIEFLEKANADLEPELLTRAQAGKLMGLYARVEKLGAFGVTALSGRVDDASVVATAAGTSVGKAKAVVATGKVLGSSAELNVAMQQGAISLDQAAQIASAEQSAPGAAKHLVPIAQHKSFHELKDRARQVRLGAEQHHDLAGRQRKARFARTHTDELGMMHLHLCVEPHVGAPMTARAEAEAARIAKAAKAQIKASRGRNGRSEAGRAAESELEPFERYLADAYAKLLSSTAAVKGGPRRPELVVLVSHGVAKRGWKNVKPGEVCKIPGIGPVAPKFAKELASDAFLTGVFYDGKDLRMVKRWTRSIPVEVALALELGDPPGFDGVKCVDCGNRFRTEFDHVEPRVAGGPCSNENLKPRCWTCHRAKTDRDRRAGKLRGPPSRRRG